MLLLLSLACKKKLFNDQLSKMISEIVSMHLRSMCHMCVCVCVWIRHA